MNAPMAAECCYSVWPGNMPILYPLGVTASIGVRSPQAWNGASYGVL